MLGALRQAQRNDELHLVYQPIVQADQKTVGYEALIRWHHPGLGIVSPAEFIPVAEHTGLILPIGEWVLRTACRQLARWKHDTQKSDYTLAVNVSARQFRDSDFVQKVVSALAESGANPGRLRLELTESMFHTDLNETVVKMQALQAMGVRFSLDDFGTGYSSLSYLQRLSLDELKIDRSFVSRVHQESSDAAIVRTILALAKNLGLHVLAEGVENQEQLEFLKREGCDFYQGYLFGRPHPLDHETPVA